MAVGYLFAADRMGYLAPGKFVPQGALDPPKGLEQITREFLRTGSEIALAFTYCDL